MNLASNPYVKAELDNLQFQFGAKALLDLDDYCALFNTGREKASRHLKKRGVPNIKVGQDVYIPILELALYLARKRAEREGRIIVIKETKEDIKNRSGFARQAHEAQLRGHK